MSIILLDAKNKYYKLHYGNFFNCLPNEKRKLKCLLRLKKQPLMIKKDVKKYLNNLFSQCQIEKEFHYYFLSPTESDIYIDITKKSSIKKISSQDKAKSKKDNIPIVLLRKWQAYEQKKSQNPQKDRVISYDQGYYLHSDPVFKKYDVFFRQSVSKYTDQLISILFHNPKKNQRVIAAYLLGWSTETKKVQEALEQTFTNDPEHEIHNAAGRSLFPILLKKKKIRIDPYLNLLHHPHTLCRNKACGILAFSHLTKRQKKNTIKKAFNVLEEMYNSPHPYNKRPAILLAQRKKKKKMFKND